MRDPAQYDRKFYQSQQQSSSSAAEAVSEVVSPLLNPQSVIDIGCGLGHWLRAFQLRGAELIRGVDGAHVDLRQLVIQSYSFSERLTE